MKLEGIDSHADAERVRDSYLMVPAGMVPPLPEGKYYHFQIIDLHVYTREQEYLGQITEILPTGSNDVYVVSHGGKELLIPALDEIITEVDVGNGIMTVDIPEGLR